MLDIFIFSLMILGYIVLFFGIFLMLLAVFNIFRHKSYKLAGHNHPTFSLIVPSHNEEDVIERTIKSFLATTYDDDKKEMIIVNDGSTDNTRSIAEKYASRIINEDGKKTEIIKNNLKSIVLINRSVGGKGKSYVSNNGIKHAKGEILLFIDADIQIHKNIFEMAARHFVNKNVGAVAGYVEVKRHKNFLNKLIDFEYIIGQQLLRRGFNVMGVHYIIPGGCAFIRKDIVNKLGGYAHDTLAEDTDLTWKILLETKKDIRFDPNIKVIADEPSTLQSLWNQRVRWGRGNIQVTWKHKDKVGKLKYGKCTTLAYPFWLASLILPFAFLLSAGGVILSEVTNTNYSIFALLGTFLAVSFYAVVIAGTILNKGKSFLGGLLTPGIPILISFTAMIIWKDGIVGMMNFIGLANYSVVVSSILGMWILIAIPGTYLSNYIGKKNKLAGEILQIVIFGYWMFLITTILQGYAMELLKKENKWNRTIR